MMFYNKKGRTNNIFSLLFYINNTTNKNKKGKVLIMNNKLTISKNDLAKKIIIVMAVMLLSAFVFSVMAGVVIAPSAAAPAADGVTTKVDTTMQTVISVISTAAKYIGAVIALWGVIQVVLALRREDSEGISKQVITIVVGAVLVGIGLTATTIYNNLKS